MDSYHNLSYLKDCEHTFCYDHQIICSNCHFHEKKYTEFKNMIDNSNDKQRNEILSILEIENPFENNQEHQEEEERCFESICQKFHNCLFSRDVWFWKKYSKQIENVLYNRRWCSLEYIRGIIKLDSDLTLTLDMKFWKMTMYKYSVSFVNETKR